jgi:hypothetical protein
LWSLILGRSSACFRQKNGGSICCRGSMKWRDEARVESFSYRVEKIMYSLVLSCEPFVSSRVNRLWFLWTICCHVGWCHVKSLLFSDALLSWKYHLVESGYPTWIGYLAPFKGRTYPSLSWVMHFKRSMKKIQIFSQNSDLHIN